MKRFIFSMAALVFSSQLSAADHLNIISAHRKTIQEEYIPKFKEFYKQQYKTDITVDWLDQGGAENDLKFIQNKYANKATTSTIDVFWGGGDLIFQELDQQKLLETYKLPAHLEKEIPSTVMGVTLKSPSHTWYGSALSSFGLFYNKKLLGILKIDAPKGWEDLANPQYLNNVSLADPRHSSTALFMSIIMLEGQGWNAGWKLLNSMAANAKRFSLSSSDPIKDVVEGSAVIAPAIDFYANAKVLSLGEKNLAYVLPVGKTIFNSDPIAILKGAPNRLVAERFINFVLSAQGQRLLILPKGDPQGPVMSDLARMAINPKAYENLDSKKAISLNPFLLAPSKFQLDAKRAGDLKKILTDLIGAFHVDTQQDLKRAWQHAQQLKSKTALEILSAAPFEEKELARFIGKWDDQKFRNETINQWVTQAKARYTKVMNTNS